MIIARFKCFDCGFCQDAELINPEWDGEFLVAGYLGSDGHYCGKCDGSNLIGLGYVRMEGTP